MEFMDVLIPAGIFAGFQQGNIRSSAGFFALGAALDQAAVAAVGGAVTVYGGKVGF